MKKSDNNNPSKANSGKNQKLPYTVYNDIKKPNAFNFDPFINFLPKNAQKPAEGKKKGKK